MIGELSVTAKSIEEAQLVAGGMCPSSRKRIIVLYADHKDVITFQDEDAVVFIQNGKSVTRIGNVSGGAGDDIIQAAVQSIDQSKQDGIKLRAKKKSYAFLSKKDDYLRVIKEFRESIPETVLTLFDDIIRQICGDNLAYQTEMYVEINNACTINQNNWHRLLSWFRGNVLENAGPGDKKYIQRKAFVTTVCRIGPKEYEIGSTLSATEQNDRNFWADYTDEAGG